MFPDPEDIQPDAIGQLDLFEQVLHALDRTEGETRRGVRDGRCETVYADLHVASRVRAPPFFDGLEGEAFTH